MRSFLRGALLSCMLATSAVAFLPCDISIAKSGRTISPGEELGAIARDFFTTWLVRRDIDRAMKFISANPILGSCMTPDRLNHKAVLSRADVRGVFRDVLTHTAKVTPRAKTLSKLVDSSGGIPPEDSNVIFAKHRLEQYFQIFTLKPFDGPNYIAYICKHDERRSFREAVARPNVYYLVATVKRKSEYEPVNFEILWVKQRGTWRILTISALED